MVIRVASLITRLPPVSRSFSTNSDKVFSTVGKVVFSGGAVGAIWGTRDAVIGRRFFGDPKDDVPPKDVVSASLDITRNVLHYGGAGIAMSGASFVVGPVLICCVSGGVWAWTIIRWRREGLPPFPPPSGP